ncbi:hypothetical protein BDAP_002196 [Binucleata daphniae]
MYNNNILQNAEKQTDGTYVINLDTSIDDAFLSTPDILSLFFHIEETSVQKLNEQSDETKTQRRYYADTLVCYECGETGHINKKCPERLQNICILCAEKGHDKRKCPMQICNRCYKCGHFSKECTSKESRNRFYSCRRCKYEHAERDCPMEWRRYCIVEDDEKKCIIKSCCICYKKDHFVDDCRKGKTRISIFNSDFRSIVRFYKK